MTEAGIDPTPERASSTWADFLRSQADALLACDFLETVTLSGTRMYVFAVIEHASRRIRILGTTAHPTIERWVQTCRREQLDQTLIWNQRHLLHALRQFEQLYNGHRPHQGIANARPLYLLPAQITDPHKTARLNVRRHDRPGGILHEYEHAA